MSVGLFTAPEGPRVIIDGQSLNLTPQDAALDTTGRKIVPGNFPALLMQGLDVPVVCTAVGGEGWFERIPNLPTQVYPQFRKNGLPDIVIANGGQGDMLDVPGATGATMYASFTSYVDAIRANGATHVIGTTIPAMGPNILGTGRPTTAEYAALANYNTRMMGNLAGCDAVVDLKVPPLDDATNGIYFTQFDRLHILVPGAEAMAELVRPALLDILASL
jgi:hypothetical protein